MLIDGKNFNFQRADKCATIVEVGVNHNGSMEVAKQLIREAKLRGGDIVKFQAFITEEEISVHAPKAEYQKANTSNDTSGQLEMAKALELSH